MISVKVLGPGCAKCLKLYEEARAAVEEHGAPATVEKIESIEEISRYGVMLTPALVINEQVKSSGKLPGVPKIQTWLQEAAAQ